MDTEFSHEDLLHVLRSAGVGMASVETPRESVNGSALKKGDRFHVTVYTLEGPKVKGDRRCRRVVERWADTPEEAARILRRGVLRHAKIRKVLHEAQRRIYTGQSVLG
jgi:hypothetical protein